MMGGDVHSVQEGKMKKITITVRSDLLLYKGLYSGLLPWEEKTVDSISLVEFVCAAASPPQNNGVTSRHISTSMASFSSRTPSLVPKRNPIS